MLSPGFLQQTDKSTRGVGNSAAETVHPGSVQVTAQKKNLFPHFIFPWFYFLHFAEFCPKKTVGLPIAIPIMIRFTTSSALAGKPVAARPRLQACLGGFSRKLRN